MAEEKKSPNLKDRLKKTAVTTSAAAANPGGAPAVMPPPGLAPPPGMGGDVAPPYVPGIPGLGGDVAPPAFVQQQQAAAAAAARARAAADDPFGSATHAPAGPQEVRLVIDDKPVDDKEVGRGRAGLMIAIVATGLVATAAGYLIGSTLESKNQERQTLSAMTNVRSEISRVGNVISDAKTRIDRAAERANISSQGEEGQPQAATHPPEIDEELITWFREQPPDPPFSPDVYAGRVGRLRADVVSKLTLVQLQVNELWRGLRALSGMNVANVRTALAAANPRTNDLNRMLIIFQRTPQGAAMGQLGAMSGEPNAQGQVTVVGQGIPANTTRTLYQAGPIAETALTTLAMPVSPTVGLGATANVAAGFAWVQYRQRLTEMKQLVEQLSTNHQQLLDSLSGRGH